MRIPKNNNVFVENVPFEIVNNIRSYRCIMSDINGSEYSWDVEIHNEPVENPQYYLVIDLVYNEAFAHWVFESAIFLSYYKMLKIMYPNLIVVMRSERTFKKLFLKALNVDNYVFENNIVKNNVCLFPPFMSLNNNLNPDVNLYSDILRKFVSLLNLPEKEKTIEMLVMPRQSKENFTGNPREYPMSNILEQCSSINGYYLLNTDEITDIHDQINIVRSAKTVIMTYGSAFFVNGIFTKNSNIIVLGNMDHHIKFPLKKHIYDNYIYKYNKVNFTPTKNIYTYNDIKQFI